MSGTKAGGKKAAETNRLKYGNDFYKNIGKRGGMSSNTGGFASEKIGMDGMTGNQRARIVGAKGGRISSRSGIKNGEGKTRRTYA